MISACDQIARRPPSDQALRPKMPRCATNKNPATVAPGSFQSPGKAQNTISATRFQKIRIRQRDVKKMRPKPRVTRDRRMTIACATVGLVSVRVSPVNSPPAPQSMYRSLTAPSRCRTRAAATTSRSNSRAFTPIRFRPGSTALQWVTQPQAAQR